MLAATRSRRKKIRCFATGLRYGAIGRGICLKSELFKLRQAPKRRQRMLRNDRGAFFRLRLQAALQRVRGSLPLMVSLPCGPVRAPVSEGKICSPVSAVTIPRFRRRRERNGLPFLFPLSRGAVSEGAAELSNCIFCRERGRPGGGKARCVFGSFCRIAKRTRPGGRNIPFPPKPPKNKKRENFPSLFPQNSHFHL